MAAAFQHVLVTEHSRNFADREADLICIVLKCCLSLYQNHVLDEHRLKAIESFSLLLSRHSSIEVLNKSVYND